MRLDRIDLSILEHLQRDGRATSGELGEAAGLSPSPAHRRQKLLEEAASSPATSRCWTRTGSGCR